MQYSSIEDIEAIKKVKARYFRFIDQKRWDDFGGVFAEDVVGIWDGFEEEGTRIEGRQQIVDTISRRLIGAKTVHHGHMPEIELTSPTTAVGIWAMFDYVEMPEITFTGYGHYEEEYVRQDDGWKIKSLRLVRLQQQILQGTGEALLAK